MSNLLSQLTKSEQTRLLEEMNYMNLAEIRGFCTERGIPYRIVAEYPSGKVKVTKDTDRKPIVLARIRNYLATGKVGPPTCIPAKIVRNVTATMTEVLPSATVPTTTTPLFNFDRSVSDRLRSSGIESPSTTGEAKRGRTVILSGPMKSAVTLADASAGFMNSAVLQRIVGVRALALLIHTRCVRPKDRIQL